jgi:hypothetical protein
MAAGARVPTLREDVPLTTQTRRWTYTAFTRLYRVANLNQASVQALVCAGLLFVLHFWLTTRYITFPFWYHWDEEGKATQVIAGSRNVSHPILLLNSVTAIQRIWLPGTHSLQHVTVVGRVVSAAFAAGAVSAMSLAAWIVAGPVAGLMAGILFGLDPGLFRAAHFFKEDSVLLFGWAALLASLAWYRQRPGLPTALLAGAAGAVCASGKYIGVLPVILAVPFLRMPGTRDRSRTTAFLGAFVAVYAALNFQLAQHPKVAVERIGWEVEHQLYDETGADRPWEQWIHALGFSGIVAMGIGMVSLGKTARQDNSTQWFALATMVIYFGGLSFVVRMTQRYMLPIYLVSWWFAGLGVSWLIVRSVRHRFALVLCGVAVAALVAIRSDAWWSGWKQFSGPDTRVALARQLDQLARVGDLVMLDFTVKLPGPYAKQRDIDGWMPATRVRPVEHWDPAQGHDMYETILREGFTLVAVSPAYVRRYLSGSISGKFGQFGDADWRRPFYRRLVSEGRVEAVVEGVAGSLVSPSLTLIRIADPR